MRWGDEGIPNARFEALKKRSNAELEALGFGQMNMSARGILSNRLGSTEYEKRCRAWGLWGANDFKTVGVKPGSQEAFDRYISKRDELRGPPRDVPRVEDLDRDYVPSDDEVEYESVRRVSRPVKPKKESIDLMRPTEPDTPKQNPYITATQNRFKGLFDDT